MKFVIWVRSAVYCASYWERWSVFSVSSARRTRVSRTLIMVSETLRRPASAVSSTPLTPPSCSFAAVRPATSARTDWATAKAAPSSFASETRKPVETRFCVVFSASFVRFSDCNATMAPRFVFTELRLIGIFPSQGRDIPAEASLCRAKVKALLIARRNSPPNAKGSAASRQRSPGRINPEGSLLHVHGLAATLAIAHFKRNLLALLNILLAGALQNRGMQEHVLTTIFRGHEAEAADLVEPLHGAADIVGRPAFVAPTAEVTPGRTVAERTRRAVAEATTAACPKATATGAETTATAKVTARRTVAEVAARRAVAKATTATGAEATTTAKVTARRTVAEVTARRAVAEATTTTGAEITARRRATAGRTLAALHLDDAGHEAPALAVGADFTDELVARVRRFDPCLGQRRGVKENVGAIRPQHEAEALAAIVPFHLGLDRPGATLIFEFGRHVPAVPHNTGNPAGCRVAVWQNGTLPCRKRAKLRCRPLAATTRIGAR